jgi:hypothetical protein
MTTPPTEQTAYEIIRTADGYAVGQPFHYGMKPVDRLEQVRPFASLEEALAYVRQQFPPAEEAAHE